MGFLSFSSETFQTSFQVNDRLRDAIATHPDMGLETAGGTLALREVFV